MWIMRKKKSIIFVNLNIIIIIIIKFFTVQQVYQILHCQTAIPTFIVSLRPIKRTKKKDNLKLTVLNPV